MRTVYKYPITVTDQQTIMLPSGYKIVHVGRDAYQRPAIWAEVSTDEPEFPVIVNLIGTGRQIPGGTIYRGSFNERIFVWHVYI